ncbi:MAG: hypothetical protein PHN57_01640 [Candidatus Omnitrophica bacterium]|nr:hypothetical protein [Candidatus Omnitrophota bacterium]
MPEEKILVTDIVKEVGNKALSLVTCRPFIEWVLEKVPIVIEHDISAILISDSENASFYHWLNQPLEQSCVDEFNRRVLDSLNSPLKSSVLKQKFESISFDASQPILQNQNAG